MGAYVQVLLAIGIVDDILLIAKDDILGRKLQDLALPVGKRASKRQETHSIHQCSPAIG